MVRNEFHILYPNAGSFVMTAHEEEQALAYFFQQRRDQEEAWKPVSLTKITREVIADTQTPDPSAAVEPQPGGIIDPVPTAAPEAPIEPTPPEVA